MLNFVLVEVLEVAHSMHALTRLETRKYTEQSYVGRDQGWVTCYIFSISAFRAKIFL